MVSLKTVFYISIALLCILIFVIAFMYLKLVKARVQMKIAKEEYQKELEKQKAEYAEKGVNTFKASEAKKD